MRHTKPPREVLGGCRLFVARGDWRHGVWGDVTCSSTPREQHTQTQTRTHKHTRTLVSVLAGQSYSFRRAPQPPAEGCCHWIITNTHRRLRMSSQIQETNVGLHAGCCCCCCLSAAVWWCSQWPTFLSLSCFILDLMKSWVANLKPCRARIILSRTLEDWKYTHLPQHGPFKIYSETL